MTASSKVGAFKTVYLPGIPLELRVAPRWGLWRYEKRGAKLTKVPYSAASPWRARSDHSEDWTSFEEAAAMFLRHRQDDGLGFLLGDGWGGFDLDKCRDPVTGAIEPWAAEIVAQLDSYTEISPSMTGLKVFFTGAPVQSGRRRKGFTSYDGEQSGELEVYTDRRFFTVTGQRYVD